MIYLYQSRKQSGFTLIELLVVIAIIGLLASVVLASLNSAREKGADSRRKADLKQVQLALELFYDQFGSYPGLDGFMGTGSEGHTILENELVDGDGSINNTGNGFMPALPKDPEHNTSTHQAYMYYLVSGGGYCLYAQLADPSAADQSSYDNAPYQPRSGGGTLYNMNYALCGG